MKTFCKYEMTQTQWGTLKKKIQQTTTTPSGETVTSYVNCAVVELGKLCLERDEEGNCIKENTKVSIDILWYVEPLADFSAYEIFPEPCGVHIFAGCEQMYLEKYCQKFPDYCKPKPIDEIN